MQLAMPFDGIVACSSPPGPIFLSLNLPPKQSLNLPMSITLPQAFAHQHAAHCESGVMVNLLRQHGLPLSEAMVFGLSSALAFAYLPFIKVGGLPLVSYRMPPRRIIKGLQKPLGMRMHFETFRQPAAAQARLDEYLQQGQPVGLQTSVYWLPYFPPDLRFHFNAHNLLVFGKEGENYLISDPVFEDVMRCPAADLQKARFATGPLAPKGMLYVLQQSPHLPDWPKALPAAIRKTCRAMLQPLIPWVGVRGMCKLAQAVRRLPADDVQRSGLFIGHIVRMQEEIGTGGAGFRFLYAAFLQEAADLLQRPAWQELADQLVAIGDQWREWALLCARMLRGRQPLEPALLADRLEALAQAEQNFFRQLQRAL